MKKKSEILPNNICFITHQLEHLHNVSVSISFKAGSLYESKYNNGISHLVEHLFFRQLSDLSQESLYFNMQKSVVKLQAKLTVIMLLLVSMLYHNIYTMH